MDVGDRIRMVALLVDTGELKWSSFYSAVRGFRVSNGGSLKAQAPTLLVENETTVEILVGVSLENVD